MRSALKALLLVSTIFALTACEEGGGASASSPFFRSWFNPNVLDEDDNPVGGQLTLSGTFGSNAAIATFRWATYGTTITSVCGCATTLTGDQASGTYAFGACTQRGQQNQAACDYLSNGNGTYASDGSSLTFNGNPVDRWTPL